MYSCVLGHLSASDGNRPPTAQKGIYWPVGLQSPCTSKFQVEVGPGSQATPQELASLSGDPPEGWQRGTHGLGLRPTHQPSKSSQGSLSLVDPCPLPTQTSWPGTWCFQVGLGHVPNPGPGGEVSPTQVSWPGHSLLSLSSTLRRPSQLFEKVGGRRRASGLANFRIPRGLGKQGGILSYVSNFCPNI